MKKCILQCPLTVFRSPVKFSLLFHIVFRPSQQQQVPHVLSYEVTSGYYSNPSVVQGTSAEQSLAGLRHS